MERQFCDDERTNGGARHRLIDLERRPDVVCSGAAPVPRDRGRHRLERFYGPRIGGPGGKTTNVTAAGRLNYLPRSYAHVDSRPVYINVARTHGLD